MRPPGRGLAALLMRSGPVAGFDPRRAGSPECAGQARRCGPQARSVRLRKVRRSE
jgi:hypothetical protein